MRFHVRGRVGAIPLGPLRLGAALVYLGGLALAPVLPPRLLAWFAIASLALIGAAWVRGGRCTKASEAVWLWPPIQLAIHATSGLASPLLPLLVGWIITLGAVGTWIWASAGGIVGTILLLATAAWVEPIVPARAAEAVVLAAIGCAAAWLIEVTRWRATVERRTLARILSEAEAGSDAPPEAAAAGRLEQLEWSLAGVRRRLGADRVVLWQLDEDDDLARAMLASGGGTPDSVALSSSPFDWVWREGLTVRLDAPPTWAPGAAAVWLARVEGREGRRQILSAEFGAQGAETTQASMAEEAEFLSAVLRIHGREARAVAAREHMERVLGFLGRIPAELEIGPLARTLATSAMEVTGATGAAVVRWDGIAGRVLVVAGEDGGPAVGATFGEMESEVALAIRNDAPIVREDRRPVPGALPAVSPSERWHAQPTALAAYPLRDDREILGAVIVWTSGRPRLDQNGLDVLEAVLPYATYQFRHALELGSLRQGGGIDPLTGLPGRVALEERYRSECARALRYQRPFAVAIVRLDDPVEGAGGRARDARDAAVAATANILAVATRDADTPARYDERSFVVMMPETDIDGAEKAAARLCEAIAARPIRWRGTYLNLTASAGVSAYPNCVAEPESLLRSASDALANTTTRGRRSRVRAAPRLF